MQYPEALSKLISCLKRLPGVGPKSAERCAFDLMGWPKEKLFELSHLLANLKENLGTCEECGALMGKEGCLFCDLKRRDPSLICVVSSIRDLYLMEETREYRGLYHVLSFHLAPYQGRAINLKSIEKLKMRIQTLNIAEVVLAFDATLDGDATALFLKKELSALPIQLTRLAFGIPCGSSFDFVDGATLSRAFQGRQRLTSK